MRYFLNFIYLLAITAALPWLLYSAIWKGKYREGYGAKFFGRILRREDDRACVWFHAVSAGEVNLLATLVSRFETACPNASCVISTTTKTGFDLAQKKFGTDRVFYCPLDFSWSTAAAVRRLRPDLLVLAELELWPNLITAVKRQGGQVAVVNGRLSQKSARGYAWIRPWMRRILASVDIVAAQDGESAERFRQLGMLQESVVITGSLKFDGARMDRKNPTTRALSQLAGISPDDIVFLAGSTQAPEELLALESFQKLRTVYPQLRLLLVPRHPERFEEVAQILERANVGWQRRSALETAHPDPKARILLVDSIGELGFWWGTASIAFVGGSLGSRGGQNMIEPAAYGATVSFGPKTQNFRDIVKRMTKANCCTIVEDGKELTAFVERCLTDRQFVSEQACRARQLVLENQGATDRTVGLLRQRFPWVTDGRSVMKHWRRVRGNHPLVDKSRNNTNITQPPAREAC